MLRPPKVVLSYHMYIVSQLVGVIIIIFNNYWMRLSGISRIIEAEVGVICRSRRLRKITLTEASVILDIPRKPNSIIILLFTWSVIIITTKKSNKGSQDKMFSKQKYF